MAKGHNMVSVTFEMRGSKGEAEKRARRLCREINDRWGVEEVNYQITPTVVSAQKHPGMGGMMEEVAAGRSKPPTVH